MSKLRGSSVLAVVMVFTTFLTLTTAFPSVLGRQPNKVFDISKYAVPLSDGPSALVPPTSTLTLKAITLGRGTQNYTCPPHTPTTNINLCTAIPTPAGAVATLYDASPLLAGLSTIAKGREQSILNLLPSYLAVFDFSQVLSLLFSSTTPVKDFTAVTGLPVLGQHYFDSDKVPTFDLGDLGVLKGRKVGSIPASVPGAVDWMELVATDGTTPGLCEVYRVVTAGGKAPDLCKYVDGHIEVDYAAEYWFFG